MKKAKTNSAKASKSISKKKKIDLGTSSPKKSPAHTSKFSLKQLFTWRNLALVVIVALALFTRFYKLATLPAGLNLDEAATAYDAFCLAFWRVNRQMMHLPVYLPNFGGGQSALYAYLDAILIRIFGLSTFVIRLPAAIFSLALIFFGALIVKEALGKKAALLTAFLLTIFPYFICQGRFGWDCNLLLGCFIFSFFFLLMAIKKQKWYWWTLSGLSFGVTLYAYALGWIVLPVFLFLTVIYLLWLKKINWRQLLIFGVPIFLLALPLITFLIINIFDLDPVYSRFFYIPKLNILRTSEFSSGDIMLRLLDLPKTLLYVSSPENFESFMVGWSLYAWSVPFFIFGIIQVIKKAYLAIKQKQFAIETLICFWLLGGLVLASCLTTMMHNHNSLFFPLAFCIVYGCVWLSKLFAQKWRKIYWTIVVILYSLSFGNFCYQYFTVFADLGYRVHFDDTPHTALTALYQWGEDRGLSKEQMNQHTIWIDVKYIFYYLGEQTPPTLSSPTLDVLNEVRHQNIQFEFLPKRDPNFDFIPKEIDPRDIYIITAVGSQDDYINELKELGLQEIYRDRKWVILLDPDFITAPTNISQNGIN